MSTGKLTKLGALALMAAGQVMADNGGCVDSTSYDFITRTMGHVTYTLLRPTTTWDPYAGFVAATDGMVTVTSTSVETVVSTSVSVLTVTATVTPTPPNLAVDGVEKRDVTTVTAYGGYGTLSSSTGVPSTAMGGPLSTTTVSATSTTTITASYFVTYTPPGTAPTATATSTTAVTTSPNTTLETTTSVTSSVGIASTAGTTGTNGTLSTFSSSSTSAMTTNSDLTVPAESETSAVPKPTPTQTQTAGGDRAVPQGMAWMAAASAVLAFVFAI